MKARIASKSSLIVALLAGAALAPPAYAARQLTVTTSGGTTTVTAVFSAGEPMAVRCSAGRLALAADLVTTTACAQVGRLVLEGSDLADAIDLGALAPAAFPVLARVSASTKGGADRITGGALGETLTGGPGADVVRGNGGNDTVTGGQGDDDLGGGAGADSLDGGDGTDVIRGCGVPDCTTDGADTLTGGLGTDTLLGGPAGDTIAGGGGDDTLRGEAGADTLRGDDGADVIDGDGSGIVDGPDALYGGAGSDTIMGTDDDTGTTGPSFEAGERTIWRITRDSRSGSEAMINGGIGAVDLTIDRPGEWSFAPAYDAGGASVREVRTDGALRWRLVLQATALTVHMSAGNDRANAIVNNQLPITIDAGAGTDRLSVGVPGGVPVTDSGSAITGIGPGGIPFKPLSYAGFEQRGANWVDPS